MLTALKMSVLMIPGVADLARIGWACGRRTDRLVIAVDDRPRSWLLVKRAILESLTDDEYVAYEATLPPSEQHRRVSLTWEWRHLSRRCAMLKHLEGHTDESYAAYEASLPVNEMARRLAALTAARLDVTLYCPVREPVPA